MGGGTASGERGPELLQEVSLFEAWRMERERHFSQTVQITQRYMPHLSDIIEANTTAITSQHSESSQKGLIDAISGALPSMLPEDGSTFEEVRALLEEVVGVNRQATNDAILNLVHNGSLALSETHRLFKS